jgi:hypothetical protein
MWSGPRNVSTALLRSWGNRADTAVVDEPLYAHYLAQTGLAHPGADRIVAQGETDWREVVDQLTGPVPGDRPIYYQKHMAHHLLGGIERGWMERLEHAFLIRDPAEMLPSLDKVWPDPVLCDTGLPQQVELFEAQYERTGKRPAVVDARDLLAAPRPMLESLCDSLGVPFDEAMLAWPAGRRDPDGVWAPFWYGSVERSTGFAPWKPNKEPLPDHLRELAEACRAPYETLASQRLRV